MSLTGKFLAGSDGPYLRQKVKDLIDAGTRRLVINFSEVPYIDSTGLGFLTGSRITAKNAGVALILTNVNEHVLRILEMVQLTQFFEITKDESSALAKLKAQGESNAAPPSNRGKTPKRGRPAVPSD